MSTNTTIVAPPAPDHAARGHHRFGMSRLNYLDPAVGGCRGHQSKEGTSAAADEGTMLHEYCEAVLRAYLRSGVIMPLRDFSRTVKKWDDVHTPLLEYCFELLENRLKPGTKVFIELKTRLVRDDGTEINYGHLDLFLVHPDNTAHLIDWKFGSNPVVNAQDNRQGHGYAASMGQMFPNVSAITVEFVMPRLRWTSSHTFQRSELAGLQYGIEQIIKHATEVQAAPTAELLNPGAACEYCRRIAECPGYLRKYGQAVQRLGGMTLPTTFDLDAITTPESAAIAKAWLDFLDLASGEIKRRVEDIARINGGVIETKTESGETIRYEMRQRGLPRKLGNAVEIADVLKHWVDPATLLGAADLSLEKTLELASTSLLECKPDIGSKKAARETLLDLLEVHGLISKPDGKIEYLKRNKTK